MSDPIKIPPRRDATAYVAAQFAAEALLLAYYLPDGHARYLREIDGVMYIKRAAEALGLRVEEVEKDVSGYGLDRAQESAAKGGTE